MPRVAQTFPQFPLLATELQQQIWSLVITAIPSRVVPLRGDPRGIVQSSHNPQNIDLRGGQKCSTIDHESEEWDWEWCPRVYTSPALIPAPLHICSLSRSLALKRWKLSFGAEEGDRELEGKIWFDFESNVLCFDQKGHFGFTRWTNTVPEREKTVLRRIAIDFDGILLSTGNLWAGEGIADLLMNNLPMLEEIVLIRTWRTAGGEEETRWGRMTFVENAAELDILRNRYKEMGRHCPVLSYMDYTREYPELFKMVNKFDWLLR